MGHGPFLPYSRERTVVCRSPRTRGMLQRGIDPVNPVGRWRRGLVGVVLPIFVTLVATQVRAGEDGTGLNAMCPVMSEEQADPSITMLYEEKIIAFCCDRCVEKFAADPQRYLARLPQFASAEHGHPAPNENAPHMGHSPSGGTDESDGEGRTPLLARLHPAIIHFPLAGIPLALLGFIVSVISRRASFAHADVPALIVGATAAVAAVITGNMAHEASKFGTNLATIAERHQLFATTSMILALTLVAVRIWRWRMLTAIWRCIYGSALLIEVVLLTITGYLGASLVYGPDHLRW